MPPSQPNSNGRGTPEELDHESRMLEAITEAHDLPGYYPIVVIARMSRAFTEGLEAWAAAEQGDAPYRIRRRTSRRGTYVSYRLELYVETATEALARKASLTDLDGVIVML